MYRGVNNIRPGLLYLPFVSTTENLTLYHVRSSCFNSDGDSEFAGCLLEMTDKVVPFYPSRQQVPEMERRAWKASYNYQRRLHPLVSALGPAAMEPTAVHVSMIQSVNVTNSNEG